jgi:hypothetical protein
VKRILWISLLGLACTPATVSRSGSLAGANDIVMVDELSGNDFAEPIVDARLPTVGLQNAFEVVTSTETSELRVLRNFSKTSLGRTFVSAPNPLETLSIPVGDRITMLAVDEGVQQVLVDGRETTGRRVTGRYVYAARAGGRQISIVAVQSDERRQVIAPYVSVAPITALAAFMAGPLGEEKLKTSLPAETRLYFATEDGSNAVLWRLKIPTDLAALRKSGWPQAERLVELTGESVAALVVLPALKTRVLDGRPFCATESCLAFGTRADSGRLGRSVLFEPSSQRVAPLGFPGPVREIKVALGDPHIYAILNEEFCGSTACGGVVGVNTLQGVAGHFELLKDFSGQPMRPIRSGVALPQGLALTTFGQVRKANEFFINEISTLSLVRQQYELLGAFSSSDGQLSFFDGVAGIGIDYDGRKSTFGSAFFVQPGPLSDGGFGYFDLDGGYRAEVVKGLVTETDLFNDAGTVTFPVKNVTVAAIDAGAEVLLSADIADGYFDSQNLNITNQGVIQGLVGVPITSSGSSLAIPNGYERRVQIGDIVQFVSSRAVVCDEKTIQQVVGSTAFLSAAPTACGSDVTSYQVRAGLLKPYVVSGDVDGFLGRGAAGDTVEYTRLYQSRPDQYDGLRPALRVLLGTMLGRKGAYWAISLLGRSVPYRVNVDLNTCGFSVPGRVVFGVLPTNIQNAFRTIPAILTAVPSANAVVEMNLTSISAGVVSGLDNGVLCYR